MMKGPAQERELSFVEHLEEFRRRLIYVLVSVGICFAVSMAFARNLLCFLTRHLDELVFISPTEVFISYLSVGLVSGIILSLPVIFYNLWRFAWIALTDTEKRAAAVFIPLSIIFFFFGAAFSFFIVTPLGLHFLITMAPEGIKPMISVMKYVSFVGMLLFAFGVAFELPIALSLLTKLGIITPAFLAKKRKYAVLIIFIAAAILTPPDAFTQVLMAIPLIFLYELGIVFSKISRPRGAG
ncbi:MAG: twin arginine-targeting protein translocase TatC [Candidatus Omnitrophica bacterium CG1_02_49_10]|nr:MAG: twin arginine-targeting protein translocase TatC [Candidatus Omnitrophica bacterium CG1_02_49_10]